MGDIPKEGDDFTDPPDIRNFKSFHIKNRTFDLAFEKAGLKIQIHMYIYIFIYQKHYKLSIHWPSPAFFDAFLSESNK